MVSDLAIALLEFDDKLTDRVVGQDQPLPKSQDSARPRCGIDTQRLAFGGVPAGRPERRAVKRKPPAQ